MSCRRIIACTLACLAVSVPAARQAAAQSADITITQPDAWNRGRAVASNAGDTIRVRGVATHPAGVARVLINGVEARLRRDAAFPNIVDFEGVAVAVAGATNVVISLVPTSGSPVDQRLQLTVSSPAPPPVQRPQADRPPQGAAGNPWGGFWMRGLGYAALAGGGVALTMMTKSDASEVCRQVGSGQDCFLRVEETASYRSVGLGLIGVAAVATLYDVLTTSRRAARAGALRNDDSSAAQSARLGMPELTQHRGRVGVALIRLHF